MSFSTFAAVGILFFMFDIFCSLSVDGRATIVRSWWFWVHIFRQCWRYTSDIVWPYATCASTFLLYREIGLKHMVCEIRKVDWYEWIVVEWVIRCFEDEASLYISCEGSCGCGSLHVSNVLENMGVPTCTWGSGVLGFYSYSRFSPNQRVMRWLYSTCHKFSIVR